MIFKQATWKSSAQELINMQNVLIARLEAIEEPLKQVHRE